VTAATEHREPPVSRGALWFAFLGGPIAWSARLLASYPMVSVACRAGTTLPLNLITAATAAVGVAAVLTGIVALRRVPRAGDGGLGDSYARARFMAIAGIMISALFTYAILAEGLSALLHDPCLRSL
jgi:hypothetical protein